MGWIQSANVVALFILSSEACASVERGFRESQAEFRDFEPLTNILKVCPLLLRQVALANTLFRLLPRVSIMHVYQKIYKSFCSLRLQATGRWIEIQDTGEPANLVACVYSFCFVVPRRRAGTVAVCSAISCCGRRFQRPPWVREKNPYNGRW